MRSHESSKSDIYPEGVAVYGAGMSVEVGAHYPGRPAARQKNDNPRREQAYRKEEGLRLAAIGRDNMRNALRRVESIYVRSKAAGERTLASVTRWLGERLKLKVNTAKSAVARPWERKLLGYSVTSHRKAKLRVAPASVERLKGKMKASMRRGRGRNLGRFIKEELNPLLAG